MAKVTVEELALAASEYVRRAVGMELDGTVESLAFVDHYVASARDVSDEMLPLIAAAIGAYFGEVVVARLGGTWTSDAEDPARWTVVLDAAALVIRPAALAAEAIRQGEVEGYEAGVIVPPRWQEPLADALEAAGPVDVGYYYSLTGRLETLEHAAEILAELRRREKEPGPRLN